MSDRTATALFLAVVALFAAAPVHAAAPDPDRQVWDAYPLPPPDAAERAPSDAAASQGETVAAAPSNDVERLAIASLLALVAGGLTSWLVSRRWPRMSVAAVRATAPRELPAPAPRELPAPRRPTAPELWEHPPVAPEPVAVVSPNAPGPPDPERAWAAEIGWHLVDGRAQFEVAAHPVEGDADPVLLGSSPPLDWPPGDSRAVQALTDAVKALESTLVSAGWAPLPRGDAWYAKRFNWQPGARARSVPPARTRHRSLYDTEFARQVDRTERLRRTIGARLVEQQVTAVTRE